MLLLFTFDQIHNRVVFRWRAGDRRADLIDPQATTGFPMAAAGKASNQRDIPGTELPSYRMPSRLTISRIGLTTAGLSLLTLCGTQNLEAADAGAGAVNDGSSGSTPQPSASPPPSNPAAVSDAWWSNMRAEDYLKFDWGKLQLKPQFTTQAYFTDNFRYQQPGLEESDEILFFSPGLQLQYGSSDLNHVNFGVSYDKIFYLSHSNYDTDQQHISFSGTLQRRRLTLTVQDQVDFLSSFIGIANTHRTELINRRLWADTARLVYDATDRFKPYVEGTHSDIEYSPGSGFYSSGRWQARGGTSYVLTSRVNLFGDFHYGQESPRPSTGGQTNPHYSEFDGLSFGANGEFTTRLTGSVRFGYEQRTIVHAPPPNSASSPLISVDLTYVPTLMSEVKLTVSRDTALPSTSATTSVETRVKLAATQFITADLKWAVQLTGALSLSDLSDTQSTVLVPYPVHTPSGTGIVYLPTSVGNGRSDTDYQISLGVLYNPNRWMRVTVAYSHEDYSFSYHNPAYSLYVSGLNGLRPYQVNSVLLQVAIGF